MRPHSSLSDYKYSMDAVRRGASFPVVQTLTEKLTVFQGKKKTLNNICAYTHTYNQSQQGRGKTSKYRGLLEKRRLLTAKRRG